MTLEDFFKQIGYDIGNLKKGQEAIKNYMNWYNGYIEEFHKYYVYNGEQKVYRNRYSLNIAKMICENFADLIMNEKVTITLDNDESNRVINDILTKNKFNIRANQAIEKVFALGTCCILVSPDEDLGINIQFITANNIYPLSFGSKGIYECAFVSEEVVRIGLDEKPSLIKNVQIHRRDEDGEYIINNFRFKSDGCGRLERIDLDNLPFEIKTGSRKRWFIPISTAIVNNIDMDSPFGLPIYANSIDTIKALDLTYDSFTNEIQNGRKRLFVTQDALKVDANGFRNAFDPQDVVFYLLDGSFEGKSANNYVQEVNGTLRIEELRTAIQTHLDILCMKLGFGRNYYRMGEVLVGKTATEVVSENSDLFRTINKHENPLEIALIEMVELIIYIGKYFGIFNIPEPSKITIDFDDSIIESNATKREQDRLDVQMGAMSLEEYRMKWYSEDEQTAKNKISNIVNNQPEPEREAQSNPNQSHTSPNVV